MASDEKPASGEKPPEPETTASRRSWQSRDYVDDDPRSRSGRRRTRVLLVTGLVTGLITLAIVLILYLRRAPASPDYLAIVIAERNDKHFPIQAFARADHALLMRHFDAKKIKEAETPSLDLLRSELRALRNRTEPIVILFTAQALVRDDTVFVLPVDADPDNEDISWLSAREVLQAVKDCPAPHKLLILDLAHGLVDARLGITVDRVAETLETMIGKEDLNYLVLCPCSAGQFSLTSEVLKSSVLAHYLDQGLQGDADTKLNGIDVRELFEYAKPRVDKWARNNLGTRQEPRLFGKGTFTIAPLVRPKVPSIEIKAPEPYPKALLDAWAMRDKALTNGALSLDPRLVLRLEAYLMRDENRWRGGLADKDLLDAETRDLLGQLAEVKRQGPMRLLSVVKEPANQNASDALATHLISSDKEKITLEKIAEMFKPLKASYRQQVRIVADALSKLPEFTRENLLLAKAVLDGAAETKEPLIEVVYLDRLAAFAKRENPKNFVRAKATFMWRWMREREATLAALSEEPEHFRSVAADFQAAETTRRKAESRLFWLRPPEYAGALADLEKCAKTYEDVRKAVADIQVGSAALDRALAELPALGLAMCDGLDADQVAEQNWLDAAKKTAFLLAFFSMPVEKRNIAQAKLDTHGRALGELLDDLHRSLNLRKNADLPDSPVTQRQLACLLKYPRLPAAERADFINRFRAAAKKLHDETDKNDVQVQPAAPNTIRAKMSLALLRWAGFEADDPDAPLPEKNKGDLSALERGLAECWGVKGLLTRIDKAPDDRRGDAMVGLVSPWDRVKAGGQNRMRHERTRSEFVLWLKENVYRTEGQEAGPPDREDNDDRDKAIRDFYTRAAK